MNRKIKMRNTIEKMLNDILSECISTNYFTIIRYHASKKLGKDIIDAIIDKPGDVYNAIVSIFGEPFIIMVDGIIKNYFYNKLNVTISRDEGILIELKNNNLSMLLEVARKYEEFLISKS